MTCLRGGFSVLLAGNWARHRGDLSPDRARDLLDETVVKNRAAAKVARERLSFINQADLDQVVSALDELNSRVSGLKKTVLGGSDDSRLEHCRGKP